MGFTQAIGPSCSINSIKITLWDQYYTEVTQENIGWLKQESEVVVDAIPNAKPKV